MRRASLTLMLLAAYLLSPSLADACECVCTKHWNTSPLAMKRHSSAVFVGEILEVRELTEAEKTSDPIGYAIRMRVERYWKGVETKEVVVRSRLGCCSPQMWDIGRKYLVYGVGKILATTCTRTMPLEDAKDDLQALGPAKTLAQAR